MTALIALWRREVTLAFRVGGGAMMGVLFFLIVVTVIPFAVGPDLNLLSKLGPAVLWIGALLATLLGLDRLYEADREEGTLDLILTSGQPLELVVLVKCLAHWATTGLPLVLAAPLFSLFLGMPGATMASTALTLLVGTPALTFLGSIGAGLTVSLRRGGLLLPILILPFSIPVLIFGVAAANAVLYDMETFRTPFFLLAGFSLTSMVVGVIASAASLRGGLD